MTLSTFESHITDQNSKSIGNWIADLLMLPSRKWAARTSQTQAEKMQRILNMQAAETERQRRINNIRMGSGGGWID